DGQPRPPVASHRAVDEGERAADLDAAPGDVGRDAVAADGAGVDGRGAAALDADDPVPRDLTPPKRQISPGAEAVVLIGGERAGVDGCRGRDAANRAVVVDGAAAGDVPDAPGRHGVARERGGEDRERAGVVDPAASLEAVDGYGVVQDRAPGDRQAGAGGV